MNKKGFTLIELLAVILILGIIALIAIPTVNSVIKESKKGALESTGNQIAKSIEQYYSMCDLNDGKDSKNNKCLNDLKNSGYSSKELADIIGVRGDFPDDRDILLMGKDANALVSLVYRSESFACTNQVDVSGNVSYKYTGIINPKGVKCEEKRVNDDGNTQLVTNGTKHVLKKYIDADKYFQVYDKILDSLNSVPGDGMPDLSMLNELYYYYKTPGIGERIYEIKFINSINIPSTVNDNEKWDLSEKDDGSIMGWVVPLEDGSSWYTLYIGCEGEIYANPDSSFWFSDLSNLTSISFGNYKTDYVTSMQGLFFNDQSLNKLDLSFFDTSNVTNMAYMFATTIGLMSLDLTNFNTSNVTNMSGMFAAALNLTSLNLTNFNTSKVTDMSGMFMLCSSLSNLDVSNFNTSNVTNMFNMFHSASGLTSLNITNFDTSKVTDMSGMFHSASGLTSLDLTNFNTSNVTNMAWMFEDASNLTSLDLTNFNTSKVTDMSYMFYGTSGLTSLDLTNFNTSKVTNMSYMFYGGSDVYMNLNILKGVENFDVSNVEDMSYMFARLEKLAKLDLHTWNTSKVTNMSAMFAWSGGLIELDLTGWNTSNVTDMSRMFNGCSGHDIKIEKIKGIEDFDTSKNTSMHYMFWRNINAKSFDLTKWDTSNVTNMANAFGYSPKLEYVDISSFDTLKVTNTMEMFSGDKALTNIYVGTKWTVKNVTNSNNMFLNAKSLKNFNSSKIDGSMANTTTGYLTLKG